jgi:hypothetical protein
LPKGRKLIRVEGDTEKSFQNRSHQADHPFDYGIFLRSFDHANRAAFYGFSSFIKIKQTLIE